MSQPRGQPHLETQAFSLRIKDPSSANLWWVYSRCLIIWEKLQTELDWALFKVDAIQADRDYADLLTLYGRVCFWSAAILDSLEVAKEECAPIFWAWVKADSEAASHARIKLEFSSQESIRELKWTREYASRLHSTLPQKLSTTASGKEEQFLNLWQLCGLLKDTAAALDELVNKILAKSSDLQLLLRWAILDCVTDIRVPRIGTGGNAT